ncbi:MAG: Glu-tRNA(Gln) amidotransferase subunit GatD [Nanoarchaeota archaeon]|nr:Glu-tRNA(Gln) amidotransferase subunit GatD [Nanoarchaeota archaeon]
MKKTTAVPGDYVELHLMHKIYEGIFLESPESGIVLLKLDSGYNIGFRKKEVLEIKVLEKNLDKKEELVLKKDSSKPNIAMVITGGTIASRLDTKTGAVKWLDNPENLFKFYPELFEKVNVLKFEVPFMKGSENMDYKDWQKIARIVQKFLNDSNIQGVIVTHGTDTLHYTAAALSFFLGKLNKPVVLTYSQRSIDRASSDANLNLQCSALAAISDIAEVMLVGHASSADDFCYAIPGAKVRKLHSSKRDAFKPVNVKPFAKIYPDRIEKILNYTLRKKHCSVYPKTLNKGAKVKVDLKFENKIALVKFYPGQNPDILDYYVKKKYKGLIIEVVGLGHVATKESRNSWIKKLKEVQKKGLVVCAAAQTIFGRLDPLVYSTGRELLNCGIIYLKDMLAETAFVKLGWVLGHKDWNVKEKMLENFVGEFNNRLED